MGQQQIVEREFRPGRANQQLRTGRTAIAASLLLAVGLVAGCSSSANPAPTSQPPLAGEAALRSAMTTLTSNGGPPGVIAIVQNGSQQYQISEGTAEVGNSVPMSGTAALRIASVSKAYNGAVILSLVNQGKLTLDTAISKWSPAFPAAWGKATVGQLLQHTSGLPDYIKSPEFLKQFIADPKMSRTPQQLIGYVANEPLDFAPGSEYGYSDTDNIVAGLIAEEVTGKSYTELLGSAVTSPLTLPGTQLPETSAMPAGFIHGYDVPDPKSASGSPEAPTDVSEFLNPSLAWASGGMITTPLELNTFFRAYASGKLVDSTVLAQQRQFVPGAGGPPGPGVNSSGLSIYRYKTACGTFLGHTGNMPGYTLFAASTEDGTRSVVVAANSQISPKGNDAIFQNLLAVENQALCSIS